MTDTPEQELPAGDACFPIRTVAAETGVNAITLRAWERRYGLLRPVRTPSGHRLYTQRDIDLVRQVLALQDKGIPVSRAVALLQQEAADPDGGPAPEPAPAGPTGWAVLRRRMLDAALRFDDADLDTVWNDAVDEYPVDVVINFLLLPVQAELHDRRGDVAGRAAHRLFTAFLRNRLGTRYANQSRESQGGRVLLALLPGAVDDTGLLLAGIALARLGLRPLAFAAGTGYAELATAARASRARALVLFADDTLPAGLPTALAALAADTGLALFVAGESAVAGADHLRAAGAVVLGGDAAQGARLVRDILA